jgi:uncharacterized protein (DUF1501 family)
MTPQELLDNERISLSRRRILAGSAAWMAGSAAPFALTMHGMAAAAVPSDYKALVCLFLNGGNDAPNTVIPYGQTEYNQYVIAREGSINRPYGLSRAREDLLPITTPSLKDGRTLALPKELAALQALYGQGKAAIVANVGTLAYPTSKAQFVNQSIEVPPQLFSHSDQANFWQSGVPNYTTSTGWAGRMADLVASANASNGVSMNLSVVGNNIWQVGNNGSSYPVSPKFGVESISGIDDAGYGGAMKKILAQSRSNLLEQELSRIYNRSINAEKIVTAGLAGVQSMDAWFPRSAPPSVPNTMRWAHAEIMEKLQTVAQLIAARDALGQKRQVFFVSIGGFDSHSSLVDHPYLLQAVSDGLAAFYQATVKLNVDRSVTTFTASDFGRPLLTNGGGSDHGWGGHHFVVGGAVKGGDIYGKFPTVRIDGPDTTDFQGHIIPTTAVDQYGATLARWLGVADSDLPMVMPNIGRFATSNLGFMA